ncbi:MAG: type II toxin-antitoxin system HicA family toxin [Oscillospiraceae bacterium]|nr:type II toxin-antitoxin system HicA family toxin [Oscillospiraceae bacterium]
MGNIKFSELKKLLKKHGCRFHSEGGKHEEWYSPITDCYFYVGRHNSEDCKKGTLNSILKKAGLK